MNAVRRRVAQAGPLDRWLLAPIVALVAIGTVMIYSASFAQAYMWGLSPSYYLTRQLMWLAVGLLGLLVACRVDYHYWRRFSVPFMAVALILLMVVVFVPGLGGARYGADRWITVGPFTAQPSELAKLVFVLYAADWLSHKGEKVRNLWYGLVPFGIMLGVVVGLIMLEPDMGTSLVFAAIGLSMFFVAGAHLLQLAGGLLLASGAFVALIFTEGYRMNRLTTFLHPWSDPNGSGYQPIQGILALGSGGFAGLGLGVSRQKFAWLPVAYSDSIMAIVGEELGFIGTTAILVLFAIIAVRGFRTALHSSDTFGALLATGITAWIVFQAALNVAVITLSVPYTGVPMPFISFGGSSLIVMLGAVGLLLNVSRYAHEPLPERRAAKRRRFNPVPQRLARTLLEDG